jgi:hypothetical protein
MAQRCYRAGWHAPSRRKIARTISAVSVQSQRLSHYVQANGTVEIDPAILRAPTLAEFFDMTSETTNDMISGNGLARIRGSRLNFNKEAADEGIFLQSSASSGPIKAANILDNKPSPLSFQVPSNVMASASSANACMTSLRGLFYKLSERPNTTASNWVEL